MPDQRSIVRLSEDQTRVFIDSHERESAIGAACRVMLSPHEWEWTQEDQQRMARFVLWSHQRLFGIKQLADGELDR